MATYILLMTLTPEGRASALHDSDYLLDIEAGIRQPDVQTLGVYAVLGQHFSASLGGRVNTLQNLCVFSSAFAAQWGVGAIINLWPQIGEGRYDPAAHQAAFLTLIALEMLAMTWSFWPRRARGDAGLRAVRALERGGRA